MEVGGIHYFRNSCSRTSCQKLGLELLHSHPNWSNPTCLDISIFTLVYTFPSLLMSLKHQVQDPALCTQASARPYLKPDKQLLSITAVFSATSYFVAAYLLMNTNNNAITISRAICCLGFFPTTIFIAWTVSPSWRSRAVFCLAVSSVHALITVIAITYSDPSLGYAYLALSTLSTIFYYKSFDNDTNSDHSDHRGGPYFAAGLVFCYVACALMVWTQMEKHMLIQIVLNCGTIYFMSQKPTAISRILAFIVMVASSLYQMCNYYGPVGSVHLTLMIVAVELSVNHEKNKGIATEKETTSDTLGYLCFLSGLATLSVALNAPQPWAFMTFYLAVFLSLTINAISATVFADKLIHMAHTLIWSWLISVYMMDVSYHHGIIHAMLSVTTICIYSEMDLAEPLPGLRETPLKYLASTLCIICSLVTINLWGTFIHNEGGLMSNSTILVSIVAGSFQVLFCFASLSILDERYEGKMKDSEVVPFFLCIASLQVVAALGQMHFISYYEGLLTLVLSASSTLLCWLEYLATSTPEMEDIV